MKADSISPPQKSIFTPFIQVSPSVPRLFSNWKVKKKKLLKADWQMFSKLCNIYEKCWFEEGEKKKIYEALPKCQCGFQVTSMVQCRFMFNNLQVLAALDLGWGWQEGGWVGDYFTHTHAHLDMHIRALALTYSALSSFLLSGSILTLQFARLPCVWKNRATFVPTFQMVSCGRLQCPYDCTVCRG